jgi:hypothetical protein
MSIVPSHSRRKCSDSAITGHSTPRLARPAAAFVEQYDYLAKHRRGLRLQALAPVVLLGSQPSVVAMDGKAHYPLFAELRLELVQVALKVARRLIVGAGLVV